MNIKKKHVWQFRLFNWGVRMTQPFTFKIEYFTNLIFDDKSL